MRVWMWLVVLVGCYDPTIPANVPCSLEGACPGNLVCNNGLCVDTNDAGVDMIVLVPGMISVALAGNGTGAVTSNPPGINCPGDCSEEYPSGTKVELTAAAIGDSSFSGWSGSCGGTALCSVISDQGASVVATFPLNRHTLTVMKSGDGTGTVTADAGIDCGATCAADFDSGTTVVLTASGSSESNFTGWSGACSGTGPCTIDMSQARNVTATFDCPSGSMTFDYPGSPATVTRPACVTRIVVDARGGAGGTGFYNGVRGAGGKGGRTQATIAVTASDVIKVYVGNAGANAVNGAAGSGGFNGGANGGSSAPVSPQYGGGGGGASDVRRNGTGLADRIVVAGGGGGAGICSTSGYNGGDGGGLTGGGPAAPCPFNATNPTGGTQTAGGSAGTTQGYCSASPGTSGTGGAACSPSGGAGGGGGWFGGGGGSFEGGAGGSGYAINGATAVTHTSGFQSGAGQVIVSW